MHVGIPGFFEAFFGEVVGLESATQAVFRRCKSGDTPLYRDESGWQDWPCEARETNVLNWLTVYKQVLGSGCRGPTGLYGSPTAVGGATPTFARLYSRS